MKIRSHSKKGFTLVELLVAIAIVAVLAAVSVLVTRLALRTASATRTTNNMKSVGVIVESFITEGLDTGGANPPGTFPPYQGTLADDEETDFIWWELIGEAMGLAKRESGRFDWDKHPRETELQNPLSKKKLGGKGDFESFSNSANTRGGYAYNAELAGGTSGNIDETVVAATLSDSSNTIVFAESDDTNTNAGYIFSSVQDAPQGNFKESAHCYFYGNSVQAIPNVHLKDPLKFEFFTTPEEKNYANRP